MRIASCLIKNRKGLQLISHRSKGVPKMKIELFFLVAVLVLSFAAEKSRQLVGKEYSSRSWTERFTFLNCFDMSYGTIICMLKELIKLYLYYVRAVHVHKIRDAATKKALEEKLSQGKGYSEAVKTARELGNAAARRASLQVKHITGPLLASASDFLETLYVGGALAEGMVRSTGTFVGAYTGGLIGEGRLGWFGFLLGSHFGSWMGSRVALMAYDVGNGIEYMLNLIHNKKQSLKQHF